MPRVLSRLPYGAKSEPVEEFAFEEETDGHKGEKYAWMNAAYAMAANINRAFKEYGWCTRIRGVQSGGEVINLPTHTFPTDDGGVDLKCPTEIAISDRREAELAKSGLIPLIHRKNTDKAAFIGAQSVYKPKTVFRQGRGRRDGVRQPLVAPALHVRGVALRALSEVHGARQDRRPRRRRTSCSSWLQDWINEYVDGDPSTPSEATKAQEAAGRRQGRGLRERGKSRLLLGALLLAPALPARGHGYRAQPRVAVCPATDSTRDALRARPGSFWTRRDARDEPA